MKYRKRLVEVEAFQYDGDLSNQAGHFYVPKWAEEAYHKDIITYKGQGDCYIRTLAGDMLVRVGDYIIKDTQDKIYPCKPDVFEATYELVEQQQL